MQAQLERAAPFQISMLTGIASPPAPAQLEAEASSPILRGDWVTAQIFTVCFILAALIHAYELIAGWFWR